MQNTPYNKETPQKYDLMIYVHNIRILILFQ